MAAGKKLTELDIEVKNNLSNDGTLVYVVNNNESKQVDLDNLLFDGIVTSNTIASNAITADKITAATIDAIKISAAEINVNSIVAQVISSLEIFGNQIVGNTITADQIASGTITAEQIASGTITTDQIEAATIEAIKISAANINVNSIVAEVISSLVINGDQIVGNSITADQIAGNTITADQIASGTITAEQIASGTITADQIAAGTITTGTLGANSVTTDVLASNSVTTGTLGANSVTTDILASNSVTTDTLEANSITTDQIAANVITADQIAACSITATQIAACSITATEIAACSIGATQIQSGAITAQALASNIVITGSIQSRNFDGFNRVDETGEEILQYLDAGTQGFFLDERTGTAVFTDIIARDNVIAANYIKYNENSGLSAIDANGNFGINLDNDTLQIEDGRVKIKQIPSNSVIDISLYTSPNTIFFGQSETQTFELPTLNQPMNFMGARFDASTWVLSSTVMNWPSLNQFGDDLLTNLYSGSRILSYGNQPGGVSLDYFQLFHENDERDVGIYKSPYIRSSIYDNSEPAGLRVNDNSVACQVVVLHVDLHEYVNSADAISGKIELNNVKFLIDTSHISHLTNVESYNFISLRAYFSSTSGAMTDTYIRNGYFDSPAQITSTVINPTLLSDIYEAEVDINFSTIQTGYNTRYMTVVIDRSKLQYADHQTTYLGYVPLSAQFTPETNLRFEYYGALPEVVNHNLSDINCLIPGKQKFLANLDQLEFTQNPGNPNGGANAIIPFEWSSDTRHQLGHPEVDPDRDGPLVDPVTDLLDGASWNGNNP